MPDIPITQFGIENIERSYLAVKTTALMITTQSVATGIGLILVFIRFFREYKQNTKDREGFDAKGIFDMLWQYLFTLAVIVAAPFVIYALEYLLGDLQRNAISALGGEPKTATGTLLAEIEEMEKRYPTGPSIMFDTMPDIFAYFYVIYLKPPLALFIRYLYALFISGRYLYLLLLELAFPIAYVCLLSEDTAKYFYSWVSNMIVCYLMIPAFLVANALADAAVITLFDDPYTFIGIIAQFALKLYLLKKAGEFVFKLI